jgi:hypothetical protein
MPADFQALLRGPTYLESAAPSKEAQGTVRSLVRARHDVVGVGAEGPHRQVGKVQSGKSHGCTNHP